MLFLDLVGFTGLARELDSEQLRDLADAVLTAETQIISEYDGRADTLVGDGLMAVFGAPNSHPDDAQRAVLAAAESLQTIRTIGKTFGLSLVGRAGVNTGIAIAGELGTGSARRYTVMGDVVNLAAKLEAAAEPGGLLVGEETYARTRRVCHYEPVGPVPARGSGTVLPAYRLLSAPQRADMDPYRSLPIVGREVEMQALADAHARVIESGSSSEVWLVGASGSGKSRLLDAFVESVEGKARTIALDVQPGLPFSWKQLEEPVFGTSQNSDRQARKEWISRALDALLPGEPRWHNVILASLGLVEAPHWRGLDRRRVNRANLAWREALAGIARSGVPGGLVVAVDGVPADASLLEFLNMLRYAGAPILVLRTSRTRMSAGASPAIELRPLSSEQGLSLVERIASPSLRPASKALLSQLTALPAYALELGRILSTADEGSFPLSVVTLLQSHLDMLDPEARMLLTHAALTGDEVWEGLLLRLAAGGNRELVRVLVDSRLLIPKPSSSVEGEIEYGFQGQLLRRVAEDMVPYHDRPLIHLHIATWLEEHATPAFAELIANHFLAGGSPDAALGHFLKAAQREADQGNVRHAGELFERALGLDANTDLLAKAALSYAQMAVAAGEPGLALRQLDRTRDLLGAHGSSAGPELTALEADLRRSVEAMN